MTITNQPSDDALDTTWFAELKHELNAIGEVFNALELPQDELRRRRLTFQESDGTLNVDLLPRHIDTQILQTSNQRLELFKSKIIRDEHNEYVKRAYTDRIDEMITNNKLLAAAASGDSEQYRLHNQQLYGNPNQQLFAAVCDWIRTDAEFAKGMHNDGITTRAEAVLEIMPRLSGTIGLIVPAEKVFQSVKQLHTEHGGYYDKLFGVDGLPGQAVIDQVHGDAICLDVLRNIEYDGHLAYAENGIWAVLRSQAALIRPPDYSLDREEFIGIVSHEVGSHLLESVNGSRQKLRLLEEGLANYEFGSEGRAFLREQIVYAHEATFLQQASWEYIIILHLLVCLASGMYDHEYSFSELYRVAYVLHDYWRYKRFHRTTNEKTMAAHVQQVEEESWLITVRIAKGSDGTGGAYMKDIVYLEGNVTCWQVAAHQPRMILYGDLGKFDIARPEHIELLQGLGILPADLIA